MRYCVPITTLRRSIWLSFSGDLTALCVVYLVLQSLVAAKEAFRLALAPKSIDNIFFDVSRDGCYDQAEKLSQDTGETIECHYIGPTVFQPDGIEQAQILTEWLDKHGTDEGLDALAISVTDATAMRPVIHRAVFDLGLPVVTFDSDMPEGRESGRMSYIGTDNVFFGEQLGKVLKQIFPTGGTYVIVTDPTPNIRDREAGVRSELSRVREDDFVWTELPSLNMKGNNSLAIELMREVAATLNPTAIVPVMGGPMFLQEDWLALVNQFPDVIFVVADGLAVQLELLGRNKVAGLVAQMPYEMGVISMNSLWTLLQDDGKAMPDFQGTNVIQHLQIPLVLPDLKVDPNHLGKLKFIGFALAGVVALTALATTVWSVRCRHDRVVQVAQPAFLVMIALGSLVLAMAMIPLSFDDSADNFTVHRGTVQCMSVPWLACIGFTIAFCALFAKTWRVNRLFQAKANFQRVQVTVYDVLQPFAVLLTANVATLALWTALDPLEYIRRDAPGTDAWNRVLETYGQCESAEGSSAIPYLIVLGVLNGGVLFLANYQAYQTRHIQTEFSETHSIGMVLASLLQALLIGAPLLVLVRNDPQAFYLTLTIMIFVVSMVILLLVFIPKVLQWKHMKALSAKSQRNIIRQAIIESTASRVDETTIRGLRENGGGSSFRNRWGASLAPAPAAPTAQPSGQDPDPALPPVCCDAATLDATSREGATSTPRITMSGTEKTRIKPPMDVLAEGVDNVDCDSQDDEDFTDEAVDAEPDDEGEAFRTARASLRKVSFARDALKDDPPVRRST